MDSSREALRPTKCVSTSNTVLGISPASRGAQREHRATVAQHDRRTHVVQRSFARSDGIGLAGPGIEPRHAVAEEQAQSLDRHLGPE